MLASKKNCTLILRATDIAFNVRLAAGVRLQQVAAIRAKHQRPDRSHGEPSTVAISKLSRAARVCEDVEVSWKKIVKQERRGRLPGEARSALGFGFGIA